MSLPTLDPPLSDGTIALRPWTDADIPAMVEGCSDPLTQRWTHVPPAYTAEHAREHVNASARRREAGEALEVAIVGASDPARVLGSVGLMQLDPHARSGEVGYWVMPAERRRGIATRAVVLICRWAFTELRLTRILLRPMAGNDASERVAQRAGFHLERTEHDAPTPNRGPTDMNVYVLMAKPLT